MVILAPKYQAMLFRGRGRLGYTQADRLGLRTYSEALAVNPFSGVYQTKHTRKGKKTSQMNWRLPAYHNTANDIIIRDKFRAGVVAYHALSPTEKEYYRKVGAKYHMTGYNKFLSYWLKNQI